ncbi:MAG: hypothetical protein ACMUEL_08325 [Flavobacteriales bacterium Tduv]
MIVAVDSVVANEYDSIGLKSLITKLGYTSREVYSDKGYHQPTCLTFIVEISNTV